MSAQGVQMDAGMNNFPAQADYFPVDNVHYPYMSSKTDGPWHWDRDARKMLPHHYNEGLAPKMETGYGDGIPPESFEGLEKIFHNEIMRLTKEQGDAEDAENTRHREKINEIQAQYQEKLSALRAHQANRRDEFLHKESQARLLQYQEAGMSQYPKNAGTGNGQVYGGASAALGKAHGAYDAADQYEPYREQQQQPQSLEGARTQTTAGRVPYPAGRVYNNSARFY